MANPSLPDAPERCEVSKVGPGEGLTVPSNHIATPGYRPPNANPIHPWGLYDIKKES